MKCFGWMIAGLLGLGLAAGTVPRLVAAEFYVATGASRPPVRGGAPGLGSKARPFASLPQARDAIRALRKAGQLSPGTTTVWIRGGTYPIEKTFELAAEDAGTETSPIVYRAWPNEEVRLTGGREVTLWKPVTNEAVLRRLAPDARGNVLQADLKAQGITDFGQIRPRGFGRPVYPAGLELFFQDRPMQLARYPNTGWLLVAGTPAGKQGGKFTYQGNRPKRWAGSDDIWVHGYWTFDWADSYERIDSIDTERRQITTRPPHGAYGYEKGKRYYVLNVLEELDQPEEWYLDRPAGILYFWPPAPIDQGKAVVSITPTIVSMQDVSYVTFQGLSIECCRATAVQIRGGTHNLIAGCTLRNIGNQAVVIRGGTHHGVVACDISETGDGGVILSSGDRRTLNPAHLFAENNRITRFSRWCRTYRPAVQLSGVGNRVAHNLIHDAPHTAVLFGGNDHVLELNEVYDVCKETGDVGAFYAGRDWTMRGHLIRYNFFHDIKGPYTYGAMSVYLDDAFCGVTVYGNVFCRASRAAFIGGGRDNVVENNIFVDCQPAVHIDARALGWMKSAAQPGGVLQQRLRAVPYNRPPYSTRYPKLPGILDDDPAVPKGNVIVRNVCVGGQWLDLAPEAKAYTTIRDNFTEGDPGFVDAGKMNFQLKDDSPVYKQVPGFQRIPFEQIGLVRDEYRTDAAR
jgi:hypothetical protein